MDKFMKEALDEALASRAVGGCPFGAVLVRDGEIIGRGRNLMLQKNDPTGHAEMEAIMAAGLTRGYKTTVLYATAFPCLMCAGAITYLGIPKVVAGATWDGYRESYDFMKSKGVVFDILELEECKALLDKMPAKCAW